MKKWLLLFVSLLPTSIFAMENFSSQIINDSKQSDSNGYILVKTRTWPEGACILDSGAEILYPGDSAVLTVIKKKECDDAGVGYSFYAVEDKDKKYLMGYVSHRFSNGEFSLQVSMFCHNGKCVFKSLNPAQQL